MFVNRITQKLLIKYSWKFIEWLHTGDQIDEILSDL